MDEGGESGAISPRSRLPRSALAGYAARVTQRIALATCSALPDLDSDDAGLVDGLRAGGAEVVAAVWDDPAVVWSDFDLVVVRSTWDYTDRPAEFAAWARAVEAATTLANPADVIVWNMDKSYQRAMSDLGLPVVPTIWLDPERGFNARAIHTRFPAFGEFVIKPTISAGSRDTGRYAAGETNSRALAIHHAKRLLDAGRHVMVQRYMNQVDTLGETALIFVNGQFSHSVRKGPLLEGPYRAEESAGTLYRGEVMTARTATDEEREVAERVVEALPTLIPSVTHPLLYTRVDLIPDDNGNPVVLELELTEPSLFLALAPGAAERAAAAVLARLG